MAGRAKHALQKLLQIRAFVFRDRELREISADEVVPGDAVWLEAGSRVPADVRLVTVHGLEIDESLLTGESLPVLKNSSWVGKPSAPITDQANMGYAGSTVIRGRGKGLVVSTGVATAVGRLAVDVFGVAGGRPPLLERLERFSKVIAYVVLAASVVVAFLGIWRLSPLRSPVLLGGAVLALLVHIGAMHWSMAQAMLGTEPVTFFSAGILLLLALTVLVTMEAHKWIWRLRQRRATQ